MFLRTNYGSFRINNKTPHKKGSFKQIDLEIVVKDKSGNNTIIEQTNSTNFENTQAK